MSFDIASNRAGRKWSLGELLSRVLWGMAGPLFRYSPRVFWWWRNCLLRLFGASLGRGVRVDPSVRIFLPRNLHIGDWTSLGFDVLVYNLGMIRIGSRCTISQRSHLCGGTHDYRDPTMPLVKSTIIVGDDSWVCADAFIGPGVTIDKGAIVAARAVVMRHVTADTIVAGNPACEIKQRDPSQNVRES